MAQKKKKIRIIIILLLFITYFFVAARPVPKETILTPLWLSSLKSESTAEFFNDGRSKTGGFAAKNIPFILGGHFGYVDEEGQFLINRIKQGDIALSEDLWTEYERQPVNIDIIDILGNTALSIEYPGGYPIFLDNRIFIIGSEQNLLSEIDNDGNILWTYEFGAPLTCIDAAAGLVLTGSIDGVVEILDANGRRIYYFEPGGSRYSVILGCVISSNGMRIGIISGINQQRFLLLENFGSNNEYRVVYHEFLGEGYRRPVHLSFIDDDSRLVFERRGGLGCYNILSRQGIFIPLKGEVAVMDNSGGNGILFLISVNAGQRKDLVGIRFPQNRRRLVSGNLRRLFDSRSQDNQQSLEVNDAVFMSASFNSENIYLHRAGSIIIAGGGTSLISFVLEEK